MAASALIVLADTLKKRAPLAFEHAVELGTDEGLAVAWQSFGPQPYAGEGDLLTLFDVLVALRGTAGAAQLLWAAALCLAREHIEDPGAAVPLVLRLAALGRGDAAGGYSRLRFRCVDADEQVSRAAEHLLDRLQEFAHHDPGVAAVDRAHGQLFQYRHGRGVIREVAARVAPPTWAEVRGILPP